jgi:hypothetical protein
MDCAQFAEIVHDLDRPVAARASLREEALAHAQSCARCAQLLAEAESLNLALRAVATDESGRNPLPELEAALVKEFRREKAHAARRRSRWQVAAVGTAAAVLLALGLSLRYRSWRGPDGHSAGQVSKQAPTEQHAVLPNTSPQSVQPGFVVLPDYREDAAFIPLPYADDPQGLDGGAVVRVELSREALASLGWPVAEPGSGPFTADVVVSGDGTPQAIRLVAPKNAGKSL